MPQPAGLPPAPPLKLPSRLLASESICVPSEVPIKSHKVKRRVEVAAIAGADIVPAPVPPTQDISHARQRNRTDLA